MIKSINSIGAVRTQVLGCLNKQVLVKVNLGRNKVVSFKGVLTKIYPSLFTVSPLDKGFLGKTTYSFSEMLCGSVKIKPIA